MHRIITRTELLGLSLEEIETFFASLGEKPFRARQLFKWIYQKQVCNFYEMTDLPKNLRQKLDATAQISIPRIGRQRVSRDGTRKFLLELNDKKKIETVLIPQPQVKEKRYSLCISTQVGCPIGCDFCATGLGGFQRNLATFEIVGQVLSSQREIARRLKKFEEKLITNIVFMGMGEPLINYEGLIKALNLITDYRGINIGQRNITVSTAGEVEGIKRLARENLQITLAVSLHASNNSLRNRLVPLNKKYPLEQLLEAVEYYIATTRRRVTFEYILLDNVNMGIQDAKDLAHLLKPLLANINLIPYNEVEKIGYKKPSPYRVKQFKDYLTSFGLDVTVREEKGADIEAACGQLSAKDRW